jgi:hypothetical protein
MNGTDAIRAAEDRLLRAYSELRGMDIKSEEFSKKLKEVAELKKELVKMLAQNN